MNRKWRQNYRLKKNLINLLKITENNQDLLKGLPPILWINLDRSVDRKEALLQQFRAAGITDHHRISACDGRGVNNYCIEKKFRKMNPSRYAVFSSHLKALEYFVDKIENDVCLVVEDDLAFEYVSYWEKDFQAYIREAPLNWDAILLSVSYLPFKQVKLTYTKYDHTKTYSTACYLIKKSSAKRLLSLVEKKNGLYNLSQVSLHPERFFFGQLDGVYCLPLFSTFDFKSTIHTYHEFLHLYSKKKVDRLWHELDRSDQWKKFSIITASYNCGEYVDSYFKSLVNGTIPFEKYLEVIYIDDGSTDQTEKKVQKWVNQYPKNIQYHKQSNQGQSSARNVGLDKASHTWVSFIDADDTVSKNYFEKVCKAINRYPYAPFFSCRILYHVGLIKKPHILDYKFDCKFDINESHQKHDLMENPKLFTLSASSSIFSLEKIRETGVKFKDIKPHFEDGFFIQEYLLKQEDFSTVTVKEAEYLYRKRLSHDSTIDESRSSLKAYYDILAVYQLLMKTYKERLDYVPDFIQCLVLYDLSWKFQVYLDPKKCSKLSLPDQAVLEKLQNIFSNISYLNLTRMSDQIKLQDLIGINKLFYQSKLPPRVSYKIEIANGNCNLQLTTSDKEGWSLISNGESRPFENYKPDINTKWMLGNDFYYTVTITLPIEGLETVSISQTGKGQQCLIGLLGDVPYIDRFTPLMFFDRDTKADDNAEVLYRWFRDNHPEYVDICYALSKKSPDWPRLQADGFRLIDYDTSHFRQAYLRARVILSSCMDKTVEDYQLIRSSQGHFRSKFISLQHGITMHNLSRWLNDKKIDKMVCSADSELALLKNTLKWSETRYWLTGLSRYDRLKRVDDKDRDLILFFPTWRLITKPMSNLVFTKTSYCKAVKQFLGDNRLHLFLKKYSKRLVYIPHPNMLKFIDLFRYYENSYVHIPNTSQISYFQLINRSCLAITDYSSVAFDAAYLRTPIIYYRWDSLYGVHIYQPTSYWDYQRDGFGLVLDSLDGVISNMESIAERNFEMARSYQDRVKSFFAFVDQGNCQRLFDKLTTETYSPIRVKAISQKSVSNTTIKKQQPKKGIKSVIQNAIKLKKNNRKRVLERKEKRKQLINTFLKKV